MITSTIRSAILTLVAAALAACVEPAESDEPSGDLEDALAETAGAGSWTRVMTRNLYIGLDVYPLAFSPFQDLPYAVADGWADVLANRPHDRMVAIAREIALVRPHLVGLQEVVRIYEQTPSDTMLGQFTPNATDQYVDFLQVILDELAARGVSYQVAAEQLGADIEVPRFDGTVGGEPVFSDMRATVSDVILRRADTPTSPLFAVNYQARLPFPPIPGAQVPRSAIGVTVEIGGRTVRFVSTHLEPLIGALPDDFQPQYQQAAELIYRLAVGHRPELPTIVVGDFNSPAGEGRTYLQMSDAGYTDLWDQRIGRDAPGLTCCQEVVLDHPDPVLYERIDLLWTRGLEVRYPLWAFTLGDRWYQRTASEPRLWPSDHAGVAAIASFR